MKLKLPKPTVDIDEIRRLYHKDAAQDRGKAAAKALPKTAKKTAKKAGRK
jgi:hypothetical protein